MLAAIGIAYFVFEKKKSVPGIVSVLLIAGLCFALPSYSFAFWQSDITLEDESIYNYLQVQDDAKRTTLSTNVLFGVQSVQVKGNALTGMYYDYALAAPFMAGMDGTDNENRSVMILGMGSGTYASYCTRYFPGASVQGAEIDKKIADIATDYFGLPGSVTVAVEDGRAYLAASKEKFDVIMVDAYQDITIPFQLSSVEFFNEVQAHLKPNGVMVVNLNMTSAENGSINEYLCDTMASVFQHTVTAPVKGNTNTEVFCTNAGERLDQRIPLRHNGECLPAYRHRAGEGQHEYRGLLHECRRLGRDVPAQHRKAQGQRLRRHDAHGVLQAHALRGRKLHPDGRQGPCRGVGHARAR